MFVSNATVSLGPGFLGIFYCASLWVFTMMIVLFHRAGIQIVGAIIACIGFLSFFIQTHMYIPLFLFALGCGIHWFGRILYHLKKR